MVYVYRLTVPGLVPLRSRALPVFVKRLSGAIVVVRASEKDGRRFVLFVPFCVSERERCWQAGSRYTDTLLYSLRRSNKYRPGLARTHFLERVPFPPDVVVSLKVQRELLQQRRSIKS